MEGTNEIFIKRVFNTYPYIVLQKDVYSAHLGEELNVYVSLMQKDNLFGDKLVLNTAGLLIEFRLYDVNKKLVARATGSVSNFDTSEITAKIDPLFITNAGTYYGEFVFEDLDSSRFILPLPNDKTRIKLLYK